jgi:hypothetical protein
MQLSDRGVQIVMDDLSRRGWTVVPEPASPPVDLVAVRGPRRARVVVRAAIYPDLPASLDVPEIEAAGAGTGDEVWLAQVQVTRNLEPMFNPSYTPVQHAKDATVEAGGPGPRPMETSNHERNGTGRGGAPWRSTMAPAEWPPGPGEVSF